ncbi:hypothetical protein PUV54_00200 [Hyphococcus flavus]|uniref:Uncharacterized protein n=1 Tax=Hyphococcus flavus TaxID=1866326 RepID=A0AAE9ZBF1_9PROT|nr:hypothetical protein [Hyphococcus flavus]WDI31614.1 hypothetical protein PUV54_00200 [Hyphococcus flavus]
MTETSAHLCDPAATIIQLLGGDAQTARICGVYRSQPGRWKRPRGVRNGGGGVIPQRHHPLILQYARAHEIPISPSDLVELSSNVAKYATDHAQTGKSGLANQPQGEPVSRENQQNCEQI